MPTLTECEHAIEALHDFFAAWYCADCDRDAFGTVERALAEDFERVAPDGSIDSRQSILDSVRAAYGTYDSGAFEIEIRNVEPVETSEDRALVRYEEWQTAPSGTNGRVSTALFAPASGSGEQPVAWRYLQETWLESTD